MQEKVRCANCGFLGIKRMGALAEADNAYRREGSYDKDREEAEPQCFMLIDGIKEEYTEIAQIPQKNIGYGTPELAQKLASAAKAVVNKPRKCGKWYHWHPGHAPKEHIGLQMIEEQRAWQQDQHRQNMRLVLLGPLVGAAITIAGQWLLNQPRVAEQAAPAAVSENVANAPPQP